MKRLFILLFVVAYSFLQAQEGDLEKAKQFMKSQEAFFEENKGQVTGKDSLRVKFTYKNNGASVFLLNNGLAYQFSKTNYPEGYRDLLASVEENSREKLLELRKKIRVETYRMDVELVGANQNTKITTEGKSQDYIQYYNHKALNVHSYSKITYHEVYPYIDWVIYKNDSILKYDFIVRPGGNPKQIKLKTKWVENLELNSNGSLTLKNRMGSITEEQPISFQGDREIKTNFVLNENEISFNIDNYNPNETLIIDPSVLIWGTYYGGNSWDNGSNCSVDASGNVYLSGSTSSSNNIASGGHQNTIDQGYNYGNAFLVKFNSAGVRQWATYYGSYYQSGESCATDGSGNIYLSGTWGGRLIYIVKFNSAGIFQWEDSSIGVQDWSQRSIGGFCAVDNSNNVYVTGQTKALSNIASGGHQNAHGGGWDVFLIKYNSSGVKQWGTYYGGSGEEYNQTTSGYAGSNKNIAIDNSDNVYLTAGTTSTSGIASGGHQNAFGGGTFDDFLVKFNSSGVRQWATYYGGSNDEESYSCATDVLGNVYIGGYTFSSNNIATAGTHWPIYYGSGYFLVKFNSSGTRQWGTYYPGCGGNRGFSIVTDGSNNVYIGGIACDNNNVACIGYQNDLVGTANGFIVKFNSSGVRQCGTYFGASTTLAVSIALDVSGSIYLSGWTDATYNIASGGHQNTFGGVDDAFLAKFSLTCGAPLSAPTSTSSSAPSNTICLDNSTVLSATGCSSVNWYTNSSGTGSPLSSNVVSPSSTTTYYAFCVDGCQSATGTSITINVISDFPSYPIISTITQPTCATPTGSVILNGLPAVGSWTITRSPDGTTYTGSGTSYTVTGLPASASYTFAITNASGCTSFSGQNVAISAAPAIPSVLITGLNSICTGSTTTLTPTSGGTWVSNNTSIATVHATTGVVTGVAAGTANFTYTSGSTGCSATTNNVTVSTSPTIASTTPASRCGTGSITLSATASTGSVRWYANSTGGAVLSSSNNYTITSLSSTTTYWVAAINGSCTTATRTPVIATINPIPTVSITGSNSICVGATTTLSPTTGGTWVSNAPTVATVTNGGLVTGVSAGSATFTFTSTASCSATTSTVTVNSIPVLGGANSLCMGSTANVTPNTGGTWSSSNTAVATVSNAGLVTSVGPGTTTLTFTIGGCSNTTSFTVNSIPVLGGASSVCMGSTANVTPNTGGTWSSSNTSVATVNNAGLVTSVGPGTTTLTFTIGGCNNTMSFTVNPIPVLGGASSVCMGSTANVTPNTGGTWSSSNTSVATVNNAGLVTSVGPGTTTLTFTIGGCSNTMSFTVNPIPVLGGASSVCMGSTANVTPNTGGTWSSSNTSVATVNNAGLVTSVGPGTTTLTFTIGGCSNTMSFTVNPIPVLGGASSVCMGSTANVTPNTGGTWSSSNTSVATVNNAGLVTSVGPGTTTLTFTIGGCSNTKSFTVNPIPVLGGANSLCMGSTANVTPNTGGTWSSSNTSVATVNNAGLVTSVGPGTTTLTFTMGGCSNTKSFTVNPIPVLGGASSVCMGSTANVTPNTGGTWSSSNTSVATVNNAGLVTSVGPGTTTLTFTIGGCSNTKSFTVNPIPVLGGANSLCMGSTANVTPNTGGTWSSSNTSVATVNNAGLVTSVGPGTTTLTFTMGGCSNTKSFTVNPTPSVSILGSNSICVGQSTNLLPNTGGTWSSSNNSIATISNAGVVTGVAAGTATFTFTDGNFCVSNPTAAVTVNTNALMPDIGTITQPTCVLGTGSVILNNLPASGSWTITSTPAGVSVPGSGTSTTISGLSPGTYTFTVTNAGGCVSPATANVVINAVPGAPVIGGASLVCEGSTANVTPNTGGTWASSNNAIATVTSAGVVTGVSAGPVTLTYTLTATGCTNSISFTVNPRPSASISGASSICIGATTTLTPNTGGTWLSSNTGVATVTSAGVVTGVSAGSATFTFTQTSTGCSSNATAAVTVNTNALMPDVGTITQPTCVLGTGSVILNNLPASGSWTITSTPAGVSVPGSGTSTTISGLSPGTYTFTVTNAGGCVSPATANVVINAVPGAPVIGGASLVCEGSTANVTPNTGGTWASSNNAIATVTSAGVVTGVSAGPVTLTYTLTATGCTNSISFTVNPRPSASISGASSICIGATTTLTPNTGGTWLSSNTGVATVTSAGVVTGVSAGSATFTFTNTSTGCISNATAAVTVNTNALMPDIGTITQPTCVLGTGSVILNNLPASGSWTITSTPAGVSVPGSGTSTTISGLSPGTYTFTVTNAGGCVSPATANVVINAVPGAPVIGGASLVCEGSTANVTPNTGGTWASSNNAIATVTSAGVVTGVSAGPVTLTYTLTATGCTNSISFTVNPRPSASISGASSICIGATTTLTPNTGGTWLSSNTGVATVTSAGVVTGVSAGSATFTFTNTSTGCISNATAAVTVNTNALMPDIGTITQPTCVLGTGSVILNNLPASGSWTITSTPAGVSVPGSGTSTTISGLSPGTYTFTVTNAGGCVSPATANVVINAVPGAPVIGGASLVCEGSTANVTPNTGGTWASSNNAIATVTSAGVVTGVSAGPVTLTYTLTATGCTNSISFTVNPRPSASISGASSICIGATTTLTPNTGGTWLSSNTGVATVTSAGVVTGVSAGSATFTFTNTSTGCISNATAAVTVLPIPSALSGLDKDTICVGQSTAISVSLPTGMTVNWYTNPGGSGVPVSTNNPFTVSPLTTTTYYAFANNGTCNSSSALAMTVHVLSFPATPNGLASDTICIGDTSSLLVNLASGTTVAWYNNPTASGLPISTSNPLVVSPSTTTSYYAFASNGYCLNMDGGLTVTVHVLQIPSPPFGTDTFTICTGNSVNLMASIASGTTIYWYTPNVSSPVSTNNPFVVYPTSDTSFYAFTSNGYCISNDSFHVNITVLPVPPNLTGQASDSICLGDTAEILINLPSGLALNWYNNSLGTGAPLATTNPLVVTPTSTMTYYAFASNGVCRNNTPFVATVSVFTIPPVAIGDTSHAICVGDSVSMNILNALGWNVVWYNSLGGNMISNNNPLVVYPTHDTSFFVLLDNVVCSSLEALEVRIKVFEYPILSLSAQNPNCFGQTGSITASASGGTQPYSYNWPNGSTDSMIDQLAAGTYFITLTDSAGCRVISSASIVIPSAMNPQITGSNTLCSNQQGLYIVTATGANSFEWSTGDTNDSIYYKNTVDEYIFVTVTNLNACQERDSMLIQSLLSPTVEISNNEGICMNQNVLFIAHTNDAQNALTWFNNASSDTLLFNSEDLPDFVWVIAQNDLGCADTALVSTETIMIHDVPYADFDTLMDAEFQSLVSFVNNSSIGAITWDWTFGDGWSSSVENPKHDYTQEGTYEVQLIVTNIFGCKDTTNVEVIIGENLFIPNVFTPNGDGQNDFFVIPTSGIENPYLVIQNRWGSVLYETEGRNLYWDGRTHSGTLASEGTYYYLLYSKGSEKSISTGYVTLLR